MAEPKQNFQYFIEGLRRGNEEVTLEFCKTFGSSLERLAGSHLVTGLRRRLDPEDVVQSVYRTFFRRASDGQFELDDRADLWHLLCAITLTKVREQARRQLRQKRNINREIRLDTKVGRGEAPMDIKGDSPAPDASLEFTEQFEKIMSSFDQEERRIVELKLQDHTNDEVAVAIGCSERTVRRVLQRIREGLERSLAEPLEGS